MENDTSVENMPTGLNPKITCADPKNPDQPCPVCGGLGVIHYDVPLDDPRFGKLFRCPNNPIEADVEHQQRLRRLSNLEAFATKTFDNFDINLNMYSPHEQSSLQTAHSVAWHYAQDPQGWLLLEGRYGCGKTHLAAAVGNWRLKMGDFVIFITTPDLLDHLRSAFAPDAEVGYDQLFDRVRNAALLILDDLGVENPSQWAKEKLFQILNHRYIAHLPTIITTNKNIEELDERIRSRLLDVDFVRRVKISAPDYRSAGLRDDDPLVANLSAYGHMTFNSFDTKTNVTAEEERNLINVMRATQQYAQNPEGWLLIIGPYGSGKTHLAAAIANFQRHTNGPDTVMFVTTSDLLDYLRTTYAPNSTVTFDKRFQTVRNVHLLILDDLVLESASSWAKEKLFQLLDYRYVRQLATVITTAKELDHIDARLRSRLLDERRCATLAITCEAYAIRLKRNRGVRSR